VVAPPRNEPGRLPQARIRRRVPCSGSNKQIGDDAILRRNNYRAIRSIAIENPSSQEERGSLIRFAECLSSRHTTCQDCRRFEVTLYVVYRRERPTRSVKIVGFLEPFVLASNGAIEHHR
jgi:hypothetical protein